MKLYNVFFFTYDNVTVQNVLGFGAFWILDVQIRLARPVYKSLSMDVGFLLKNESFVFLQLTFDESSRADIQLARSIIPDCL